jgi:hypothetical protein
MFRSRQAGRVVVVLLVSFLAFTVQAKSLEQNDVSRDIASGIFLDPLSLKQQQTWQAIEQIIYSEDADGKLLHPTLRSLFEQLQTSEHSIYLEFDDLPSGCQCTAGTFSIERLDPERARHVAVIRLYLRNIEHAVSPGRPKLRGDFVPLAGLRKLDRIAEVLAHEMEHAIDILFNQERASLVFEMLKRTELVREELHQLKFQRIEPEMTQTLQECDDLLHELEKPARRIEEIVWRELIESQGRRKGYKRAIEGGRKAACEQASQ